MLLNPAGIIGTYIPRFAVEHKFNAIKGKTGKDEEEKKST